MTASWNVHSSRPRYEPVPEEPWEGQGGDEEEDIGLDEEADDYEGEEEDDGYGDDEDDDDGYGDDDTQQQGPPQTAFKVRFGDEGSGGGTTRANITTTTITNTQKQQAGGGGGIFGWRATDKRQGGGDDQGEEEGWDDEGDEDDYGDDDGDEGDVAGGGGPNIFEVAYGAKPVAAKPPPAAAAPKTQTRSLSERNIFEVQLEQARAPKPASKQQQAQQQPLQLQQRPSNSDLRLSTASREIRSIFNPDNKDTSAEVKRVIPKIVVAPVVPKAAPVARALPPKARTTQQPPKKDLRPPISRGGEWRRQPTTAATGGTKKEGGFVGFRRFAPPPPAKKEQAVTGPDGLPKLVGTCMDMCPVKERLDREQFKDLVIFEMIPGTEHSPHPQVDHVLAVKKYKRPTSVLDEGTYFQHLRNTKMYFFQRIMSGKLSLKKCDHHRYINFIFLSDFFVFWLINQINSIFFLKKHTQNRFY